MKLQLPNNSLAAMASSPALALFTPTDHETGECQAWCSADYRNITVRAHRDGYTELSGSLHKFWHGEHNGGSFGLDSVREAITDLSDTFHFRAEAAFLRTLEFGINVPLSRSAASLLRRAMLYKTSPLDLNLHGGKGCRRTATAQQYYFKLYDKELQLMAMGYPSPGPLARVELKATRMAFLSAAGITTLADLAKPKSMAALGRLLEQAFANVLFTAPGLPATLTKPERQLLTAGSNFNYWQDLNKQRPESLRKNRTRYRNVVARHCPDVLASEAATGLKEGWQRLLATAQSVPELTALHIAPSGLVLPGINTLNRVVEVAPEPRRCQTCGRDISGQSERSKYCSQALYGAAGKRCRNAANNPRHNTRRAVQKLLSKAAYFDVLPYIRVKEELREFVFAGLVR